MIKINRNQLLPEKTPGKPRILVAPLDWGLGHATRCIPVIYELIACGADVLLAAEGATETLLTREFPDLPVLPLQGYRVKYGQSGPGLFVRLFLQLPRLFRIVLKENLWLKNVVKRYEIDAVISDNRFGLYHAKIPAIFITHQLRIQSPFGKALASLLQKINYRFINRFHACWIADTQDNGLAGELSHPDRKPNIPCYYTGLLSRLKKTGVAEKKGHLFISLSGPEPQRTILENQFVNEISHYSGTATVVRGLPDHHSIIPSTNDIRFYNHLVAEEYNNEMEQAEYVISRSGYSTLMDIIRLGKKSIIIPTPGQTEQEYLAKYLDKSGYACAYEDKKISLNTMLQKAATFSYTFPVTNENDQLHAVVKKFIDSL